MRIVVLQHERETGLGAFAPLLDAANVEYEIVSTTGQALPAGSAFDGALTLGGSLGAHDPRLRAVR